MSCCPEGEAAAMAVVLASVRSAALGSSVEVEPAAKVPWEQVLMLANRHGVLPQLHRFLLTHPGIAPPEAVSGTLRQHVFRIGRRNLELAGELARLVRALQRADVRPLPYKGPTLGMQAYGELSSRQFEDLDLLLPQADLQAAISVFRSLGYQLYPRVTPAQERSYYRSECECWLASADETISVELHWSVRERLYGFNLDLEAAARRARPIRIAGVEVPSLAPEDLLLALAAHGIKHVWHRLKWIGDVAGVVTRHPELDWARVLQEARALRATRLVLLPLLLCELLLGLSLPPEVKGAVREPDRLLANDVARLLLAMSGLEPSARRRHALYLRSRESLRHRLRYIAEIAFTPTLADWEAVSLPDALFPLYHVVRPIRLLLAGREETGT
jgi:hypothetical protein